MRRSGHRSRECSAIFWVPVLRLKLLGDSITAGAGSSDFSPQGPAFVRVGGVSHRRNTGRRSWAALLARAVESRIPGSSVCNNGCCNLFSHGLRTHLATLSEPEDTLTLLMIGTNNRRLPDGLRALYRDLSEVSERLALLGRNPVLLSPPPAAPEDEEKPSRFFHIPDIATVVSRVAREQRLPLLDLHQLLLGNSTFLNLFAGTDGLHPNDLGHEAIFALLFEHLTSILFRKD